MTTLHLVWGQVVPNIPAFCRELIAALADRYANARTVGLVIFHCSGRRDLRLVCGLARYVPREPYASGTTYRNTAQKWQALPAMTKRCHTSWNPKTPGSGFGRFRP